MVQVVVIYYVFNNILTFQLLYESFFHKISPIHSHLYQLSTYKLCTYFHYFISTAVNLLVRLTYQSIYYTTLLLIVSYEIMKIKFWLCSATNFDHRSTEIYFYLWIIRNQHFRQSYLKKTSSIISYYTLISISFILRQLIIKLILLLQSYV